MISRTTVIGVIGAIVVIAAFILNYFISEEPPSERAAAIPVATVSELLAGGKKSGADSSGADEKEVQPEVISPVFGLVRVDPEGNTVIAGSARPNTKVQISDGGKIIGEVVSDGRGDWVFVPGTRLAPGSHVLTLSTGKDGEKESNSEKALVLVIPEPGKDIAGSKGGGDRTPLAMVVPRDQASGVPSKVIQAPLAAASAPVGAPRVPVEKTATASVELSTEAQTNVGSVRTFPEPTNERLKKLVSPRKVITDTHPSVSLDIIDYDGKGRVVFSGKAKAGDRVQVYVDNRLVGTATTDAEGRWTIQPMTGLQPGTHQIRVDQVAEKGTGRISLRAC
jgi:hypothetical protein